MWDSLIWCPFAKGDMKGIALMFSREL